MGETADSKGLIYEFGKFVLDPQERVLLADGEPVHLADKVFDTLCVLIQNNGKLLTKDEMMSSIWEESFVEEGNLAKNVSRLRKILNSDGVQLIETVPRRGYRFRADVRQMESGTDMLVHRHLRIKLTQTSGNDDELESRKSETGRDEIHSIAVLPFQPLDAHDADDIFGLGITDALITQLNRAGQIQVRPTSSIIKYNFPGRNTVSAGRELQVDAILEGRFQRFENKLRLTVQMLHTTNGDSLWADSFHADIQDIFAIQDQIAGRVVGALTKKLSDEAETRLKKRQTENVEAFQEYLKGRFYWNKRNAGDLKKAAACFERAIAIDPDFALAYAGIADIYNQFPTYDELAPRDSFPKAKAAALRALELDETLAEAHASLGFTLLNYDWNWGGAEVSFQQAIKLNPNYAMAHLWYGTLLLRQERFGEAIVALKKAQHLDPSSPMISTWMAEALNYCGETETAIALHRATLDQFEDFFPAYYHLTLIYANSGRFDEARETAKKALSLSHEISLISSLLAVLHITLGETDAAEEILATLLEKRGKGYVAEANIAEIYANLGNKNEALNWLETACTERDPNLTWLKVDKPYKELHGDPRFQKLLKQVGLAETEARMLPPAVRKPRPKRLLLALGALAVLIISALGFYFWIRQKSALRDETGAIRLTDDPKDKISPRWTNDGRIRFLRYGSDKQMESVVMNADGTNQTVVKDFANFDHGHWSPDGTKVVYVKPGDKTAYYLANADGSNEIPIAFFGGNFDWSPDSKKIAYQKKVAVDDHDIFVYSLETGEIENVTNNPAFDADPSFSPDNKQIVFASLRDGNAEIYLMNADGNDVRRLTDHPAWDSHPVFSPDGTTIAFPSDRESEDSDVYLMRSDGSGAVKRLTDWKSNEFVGPGCWSPDGTKIAFISDRDGSNDIFVISAEISRPRLVLADETSNLQFPSYSPDGKQIIFQAAMEDKSSELRIFEVETKKSRVLLKTNADLSPVFSPDGTWIAFQNKIESNTEVCLIKPDGSGLTNLTNNAARDANPAFSPDGKQIVFASNRDGNYGIYNLYVMNSDGGNQRQLYSDKRGMSVSPVWSPDGTGIIFANDKEDGSSGNFEIFKIGLRAGETEKRLTFRRRSDSQPAVSPDGKQIAFCSNTDGNAEIYLMNADGTGLLRITRNLAEDNTPRFSNDGKKIIFSSSRNGKHAIYEIEF
jgi:Tol biopolymer transport system component/TolB-like protein/Tfp pilus assembly protein PilF